MVFADLPLIHRLGAMALILSITAFQAGYNYYQWQIRKKRKTFLNKGFALSISINHSNNIDESVSLMLLAPISINADSISSLKVVKTAFTPASPSTNPYK